MIFLFILFLSALISSYTDLKYREVPNWICLFMICFGVGGNLLLSIIRGTPLPIIHSFLGLSFFFIIALFMFYSGSWGGGDGKFLMGVGALIPTYSLAIFINVAIFNVIYLVGYMLIFKVRKVKEGIPLIPVISLAIIFTLIFGNILFVLV